MSGSTDRGDGRGAGGADEVVAGRSTPARLVSRAKIVLAAAERRENKDIAEDLGCK